MVGALNEKPSGLTENFFICTNRNTLRTLPWFVFANSLSSPTFQWGSTSGWLSGDFSRFLKISKVDQLLAENSMARALSFRDQGRLLEIKVKRADISRGHLLEPILEPRTSLYCIARGALNNLDSRWPWPKLSESLAATISIQLSREKSREGQL